MADCYYLSPAPCGTVPRYLNKSHEFHLRQLMIEQDDKVVLRVDHHHVIGAQISAIFLFFV